MTGKVKSACRAGAGLRGTLAVCLCLIILTSVCPLPSSGEEYLKGPGTWQGVGYTTPFGQLVYYTIRITMNEDGSGRLTLICDGTEMSYAMKQATSGPFDGYSINRKDYPDDPLRDISSTYTGDTVWLSYHDYRDADHPGWLTLGGTVLLPLNSWDRPYASAADGYAAEETTLYPVGLSSDAELIRAEYTEYDGRGYRIVRFVLEKPQSVFAIEDRIAKNIWLRKQDGWLQKWMKVIYPGGRDFDRTYSTFDLLFVGNDVPEALVCCDRVFDPDTLEEISEVFSPDQTDRGLIERLVMRLQDGEIAVAEEAPEIRGKLMIVTVYSTGMTNISSLETAPGGRYAGRGDYYGIPCELLAENYEAADVFILIRETRTQIGTYTGGGLAMKTTTSMVIVDPARDVASEPIVVAVDNPPEIIQGRRGEAGDFKIRDAMNMILDMYHP